jgi:gliding motility-associated-like protein
MPMKRTLLSILFLFTLLPAFAKHITGGEITYEYIGPGITPGTRTYTVTLILFRDALNCNSALGCADLPGAVSIGIYNNDNGSVIDFLSVPISSVTDPLPIISRPSCLSNEPPLHYQAGYYTATIVVSDNNAGYTATYQVCCRVDGIANTINNTGATYTTEIPGLNTLTGGITDNSAHFQTGISIICYNKPFKLDFSATDPDAADVLVYSFGDAYDGGAASSGNPVTSTPAGPPYNPIIYTGGYSGNDPFGTAATIDPNTGIISGTAPASGKYVVCVVVKSYRGGVYISEHRKDFLITVADCDFPDADLNPGVFTSCDGFTKTFQNLEPVPNPLNLTYDWDFGDPASGANNTFSGPVAPHTYTTSGDFPLTLIVNKNTPCADTAYATVKVYPGFFPAFAPIPPTCKDVPVQFTDATTATFGAPSIWSWNFGDPSTLADTSHIRNPTYVYHTSGTYTGTFIVETSVGCKDTLFPEIVIVDKPDFHLPNDTLICIVDTVQLVATTTSTTGTVTWSPNYMISDIHSLTPLVSPDVTTTYTAFFAEPSGCNDTKTVTVNVTSGVSFTVGIDTTICRTDSVILRIPTSNALYYNWTATPATTISDPSVRNPSATPSAPLTIFHVRASISAKCFAENEIKVKTVPYPAAAITGRDPICFGTNDTLHASGGSSYIWSPPTYLNNANIADPIVIQPKISTIYTVTVTDILGCPKPVTKDFTVHVVKVIANAGPQDTSIVLGQPLLLSATGGTRYEWTPNTWLSDPNISNPVSNPLNNITYAVKVSNSIGCFANDTINVKVYFVPPDVYVPSAFTPAGDGLNDLFRPIALGIKSLENFRVYNRWGELLYSTKQIGEGWNGKYKGQGQNAGTYVWEVEATDYAGRKIRRKGSVILIK